MRSYYQEDDIWRGWWIDTITDYARKSEALRREEEVDCELFG